MGSRGTVLHVSDLHFGRVDPELLEPLLATAREVAPDVVVVSGDLTQRARIAEFEAARAFLDALPAPRIVVPGNHDVPLYDLYARFFRGLARYRRIISDDLEPFYANDGIAILGINTARSLTFKGGRVSPRQIELIRARMCEVPRGVIKLVVTHHPFDLPEQSPHAAVVGRARRAMKTIAACGVDVILSGHLHVVHTGHSAERFDVGGHSTLIVQAGTATSTRGRGERNSFNVLRFGDGCVEVERRVWHPTSKAFAPSSWDVFARSSGGWIRPPPGATSPSGPSGRGPSAADPP